MYLKRFVYDRLLDWKNEGGHSTLEVGGARQVGKTYLIQKFADSLIVSNGIPHSQ